MPRTIKKGAKKEKISKKETDTLEKHTLDVTGQEKEMVKLPKEIFQIEINPLLLAKYIRVYQANQRQGTVLTKTRGEVTGSTRKIYRQKGTGRARHGDIKAPIFVGGGIAHGPKPRDFSLKMNKKEKRKVLFFTLSLKNKEGKMLIIDDSVLKIEPKTKNGEALLNKLTGNKDGKREKVLIIFPKLEENNLITATRNLPQVSFLAVDNLNGYEILKNDWLIFLKSSLEKLIKGFLNK